MICQAARPSLPEGSLSTPNDSVLKLMDSKGDLIDMNDDEDGAMGKLGSKLVFTPEAGAGTQKYYLSVSGYDGNPGAKNIGDYTVSVVERELAGGGDVDTYVFSDDDNDTTQHDVIDDAFTTDAEDNRIDLSAFDLAPEELIGLIDVRGGADPYVRIDLRSKGGGTIELANVTTLDALDEAVDDATTTTVDETSDGVIQELSVYDATDNPEGIFIL